MLNTLRDIGKAVTPGVLLVSSLTPACSAENATICPTQGVTLITDLTRCSLAKADVQLKESEFVIRSDRTHLGDNAISGNFLLSDTKVQNACITIRDDSPEINPAAQSAACTLIKSTPEGEILVNQSNHNELAGFSLLSITVIDCGDILAQGEAAYPKGRTPGFIYTAVGNGDEIYRSGSEDIAAEPGETFVFACAVPMACPAISKDFDWAELTGDPELSCKDIRPIIENIDEIEAYKNN